MNACYVSTRETPTRDHSHFSNVQVSYGIFTTCTASQVDSQHLSMQVRAALTWAPCLHPPCVGLTWRAIQICPWAPQEAGSPSFWLWTRHQRYMWVCAMQHECWFCKGNDFLFHSVTQCICHDAGNRSTRGAAVPHVIEVQASNIPILDLNGFPCCFPCADVSRVACQPTVSAVCAPWFRASFQAPQSAILRALFASSQSTLKFICLSLSNYFKEV